MPLGSARGMFAGGISADHSGAIGDKETRSQPALSASLGPDERHSELAYRRRLVRQLQLRSTLRKNAFHRRWPMTWRGRRQNGRKAEAPLPAVETRHCEACDADFLRPARACRKAADPRPLSCLLTDPRSALGSSGLASQWQSTTKLYDRRGYNPEKAASFFATY